MYVKQFAEHDFLLPAARPRLWCDATVAIQCAKRQGASSKLRHLEVQHFYVQELVKEKMVKIGKIDGTKNPVNCITKFLPANLKKQCLADLGMVDMSRPAMKALLEDTESVPLVSQKDTTTIASVRMPWKPNKAQSATVLGLTMAQACLAHATTAAAAANSTDGTLPVLVEDGSGHEWMLALLLLVLLSTYGVWRLCSNRCAARCSSSNNNSSSGSSSSTMPNRPATAATEECAGGPSATILYTAHGLGKGIYHLQGACDHLRGSRRTVRHRLCKDCARNSMRRLCSQRRQTASDG